MHFKDIWVVYILQILTEVAIVINLVDTSDIHFNVVKNFVRRLLLHLLRTLLSFQTSNVDEFEFLLKRLVFQQGLQWFFNCFHNCINKISLNKL